MCGIAGSVGYGISTNFSTEIAAKLLSHRGPDDTGLFESNVGGWNVKLIQTRLAILDLSPAGHQPMLTPDGLGTLVFNGEIYNFQALKRDLQANTPSVFQGSSDTEVLLWGLYHYGRDFVHSLQGMYAFAYLCRKSNSLLLARDPAGIKPLYYRQTDESFAFASEMRAILAAAPQDTQVNSRALSSYLAYGATPQPETLVSGVHQLVPGSTMTLNLADRKLTAAKPRTWWSLKPPAVHVDATDAVSTTRELVTAAVQDHLIADVPVGVFLSAGLDSTIIAAIAKESSKDIRTFTVDLRGKSTSDEAEIAERTATRLGTQHETIRVSDEQAMESMAAWLDATDQPSIDGLNTFIISKAVRDRGIKVALSGLGADELFGGYPSFQDVPRIASVAGRLGLAPTSLRGMLGRAIAFKQPKEARAKLANMLTTGGPVACLAIQRRRLLNDSQLSRLFRKGPIHPSHHYWLPDENYESIQQIRSSPGWDISYAELNFYQRNMLLRDSDAASMAHSLELRVPFLDQRILDWVPTLPDLIRFPADQPPKGLLRKAFADALDKVHLTRSKTGFCLPIDQWMSGPLRSLCESKIANVFRSGLLENQEVQKIWQTFLKTPSFGTASRAIAFVSLGAFLENLTTRSSKAAA
ncbi:asparagine synthase (glutamine-hydrolyzing) [Pirellulaceae bacterium SH501]